MKTNLSLQKFERLGTGWANSHTVICQPKVTCHAQPCIYTVTRIGKWENIQKWQQFLSVNCPGNSGILHCLGALQDVWKDVWM
jgi:hypothetical protein